MPGAPVLEFHFDPNWPVNANELRVIMQPRKWRQPLTFVIAMFVGLFR